MLAIAWPQVALAAKFKYSLDPQGDRNAATMCEQLLRDKTPGLRAVVGQASKAHSLILAGADDSGTQ